MADVVQISGLVENQARFEHLLSTDPGFDTSVKGAIRKVLKEARGKISEDAKSYIQDNTAAKEIGRKLKMLKVERGLTSAAVCEKAGIKAPTLTAIENGYYNVGIRQITEVAAALGAHIEIVKNEA